MIKPPAHGGRDGVTDERLSEIVDWGIRAAVLLEGEIESIASELQSRRSYTPPAPGEAVEAALARYRYAVTWVASDSWDNCSDCRARLEWAREQDGRPPLTTDEMAAIAKTFHRFHGSALSCSSAPFSAGKEE